MKFLIGFSVYLVAGWVFTLILGFIRAAREEHWTLKEGVQMFGAWTLAVIGWVLVIPMFLDGTHSKDEEKEVIDEE